MRNIVKGDVNERGQIEMFFVESEMLNCEVIAGTRKLVMNDFCC